MWLYGVVCGCMELYVAVCDILRLYNVVYFWLEVVCTCLRARYKCFD